MEKNNSKEQKRWAVIANQDLYDDLALLAAHDNRSVNNWLVLQLEQIVRNNEGLLKALKAKAPVNA